MKKPIIFGVSASVLLLGVYLGILTLAQGWQHALEQTANLWYWVLILAIGFGIQVGLFSFIRQALRQRRAATTASVSTSAGVSVGSMAACCAHHLSELLPLLGLAGLATFLVEYQLLFIVLGVLSNMVGITIMLETIQRHGLCPAVAKWSWNLGLVKKVKLNLRKEIKMKKMLLIGVLGAIIGLAIGFGIPILAQGPADENPSPPEQEAWQAMHEACEEGDWEAMAEAAEEVHENIGYPSCHDSGNYGSDGETSDPASNWGGMGGHMGGGMM